MLEHVDIDIPAGTSVGIAGPSGAGKTTLIDILLGLLEPQQGAVFADGVDIRNCRSSYLQKIAYLPQTIFLLDGSIRSNVAFVVAKSVRLRFRLRRKLRSLSCSSSPHKDYIFVGTP